MHSLGPCALSAHTALILLATALAAPTSGAAEAKLTIAQHKLLPIRGDLNTDCVVNVNDLLIVLEGFDGGPEGDVTDDGVVDQTDIDLVRALFGSTCGTRLFGDLNGDGVVNIRDHLKLFACWGSTDPVCDIDGDGSAGAADLELLTANWGRTLGFRLLGDIDGNDVVNVRDVLALLARFGRPGSAADVNLDGTVDETDLALLKANFAATSGQDLAGDIDGDWQVGRRDLDILLALWGTAHPIADLNGDESVDIRDLLILLRAWDDIASDKLAGDLDGNWIVDMVDHNLLLAFFDSEGPKASRADLDGDGDVDVSDLLILNGNFGATFGTAFPGDIDGSCVVDERDKAVLLAAFATDFAIADLNGDAIVDARDLHILLARFGQSCPE